MLERHGQSLPNLLRAAGKGVLAQSTEETEAVGETHSQTLPQVSVQVGEERSRG
jgi:hypothetical protein